jgi:AcrR family transcriptional regulator
MIKTQGRPRQFDTDQALETAMRLFWQNGYEGTSIAQLADAIGVKAPSLYAAFGNKERLFQRALERYGEQNGCMYHRAFERPTAREVARAVLEGEVELVTRRNTPDGCLVVLGAVITSPASEPVRRMMAGLRAKAQSWLRERFEQARREGDLPENSDPAALACYIMTINCGLAVQAKSGVGRRALMQVVDLAMQQWPEAEPGSRNNKR